MAIFLWKMVYKFRIEALLSLVSLTDESGFIILVEPLYFFFESGHRVSRVHGAVRLMA